jgi:hypothetical protein
MAEATRPSADASRQTHVATVRAALVTLRVLGLLVMAISSVP